MAKHNCTTEQAALIITLWKTHRNNQGAVIIEDGSTIFRFRFMANPPDIKGRMCMIETGPHTFLHTENPIELANQINEQLDKGN